MEYSYEVSTVKAHVRDGRLVLDQPTTLPEGTEVELIPVEGLAELDEGDNLDATEFANLRKALLASKEDVAQGRVQPASSALAELFGR